MIASWFRHLRGMLIMYLLTANNVEIAACSVSYGVEHETKANVENMSSVDVVFYI